MDFQGKSPSGKERKEQAWGIAPQWSATAERIDKHRQVPAANPHSTLVVAHNPAGAAAEGVRGLYYALRKARQGAPLGVLGVVSAQRREGRSTVAANLALMAARETGQPTALVDFDLRSPILHRLFGLEEELGEVGVSDVLANRADFEAVLVGLPDTELSLLPGGRPELEPSRRFMSPRFSRMLAQLRSSFDEVVVDLPPLAFSDSRLLALQCSGVLLVLRAGQTQAELAQEAVAMLEGATVLGCTLNDVNEMDSPILGAARRALAGR